MHKYSIISVRALNIISVSQHSNAIARLFFLWHSQNRMMTNFSDVGSDVGLVNGKCSLPTFVNEPFSQCDPCYQAHI